MSIKTIGLSLTAAALAGACASYTYMESSVPYSWQNKTFFEEEESAQREALHLDAQEGFGGIGKGAPRRFVWNPTPTIAAGIGRIGP